MLLIHEIVDGSYLVTGIEQMLAQHRPEVSGGAGNKHMSAHL